MYTPAYIEKKIGKSKIGFHFGMGAFHIFCQLRGIEFTEMEAEFSKDQMGAMADILYSGAKFNALEKDHEITFNRHTAFVWLDVMTEKDLNEIMNTFSKAQILGNSLTQETEGNGKSPKAKQGSTR